MRLDGGAPRSYLYCLPQSRETFGKLSKKNRKPFVFAWRHRLGLVLFFACFPLFYVTPVVVPFLGYTAAQSVMIIAVTMVAIYGIWLLSIPLLGWEGFKELRHRYFGWLEKYLGALDIRKYWRERGRGARH